MKSLLQILITTSNLLVFSGCIVLSKGSTDKDSINFIKNNTDKIKEAVEFSIGATLGTQPNQFNAGDVEDPKMRRKIAAIGNMVDVTYNHGYYDIPDSNVCFKTITLFGVTEIIYDFAKTERHFPDQAANKANYYFIKVSDRIYYRRRPVPLM